MISEAGPELDARIAIEVMGWKRIENAPSWSEQWRDSLGYPKRDKPFSTDIKAAWEVLEKLGEILKFQWAIIGGYDGFSVGEYTYAEGFEQLAHAETAPLAICLAALKAC